MQKSPPHRLPLWCVLLTITLQACSTLPSGVSSDLDISAQSELILDGRFLLGRELVSADLPTVGMLDVTAGMRQFVNTYVKPIRGRSNRADTLHNAILNPGILGLHYSETHTRTAAQAFRSLGANCIAFSNLYISLAREVGLNANYQQVLLPPQEDIYGASLVLRRHVNVVVQGSQGMGHVMDFNPLQDEALKVDAVLLSDKQAFAQYYNNIAMELMEDKRYKASYLHLRKAMTLVPKGAYLWSNMGVLLGRVGRISLSEVAMLRAVQLRPSERAALTNLAAFYKRRGDSVRQDYYFSQIETFRNKNPYYLLVEAKQAFAVEDYQRAKEVLERAILINGAESLLHEFMAKTQSELGDHDNAVASLEQAISLADTFDQKARYRARLSELQRFIASDNKESSGAS